MPGMILMIMFRLFSSVCSRFDDIVCYEKALSDCLFSRVYIRRKQLPFPYVNLTHRDTFAPLKG